MCAEYGADVCVLGAGLTGATAALELAQAGKKVILVDQDAKAMNRASLRNEGKVHLGFVFAKDETLATPKLMLEGALSFHRIVRRVLGETAARSLTISNPFVYVVAEDSLVSPADLERKYEAIEAVYLKKIGLPDNDYLGTRPSSLFERVSLSALSPYVKPEHLAAAYRTRELAIDPHELAQQFRWALAASPNIRFIAGCKVTSVQRGANGFHIVGDDSAGCMTIASEQVVNALWEERLKIDRTIGIDPTPGWLHRLKYRVIARVPDRLRQGPSVTMVLGRYGDVVMRKDGTAYFSWYPAGLQGWSHELAPPSSWNEPCSGIVEQNAALAMAQAVLSAVDEWYSGAADCQPIAVDAGAIVAYGLSDVDDPKSGLHDRTRVGVRTFDGYHTVDPGKLTTAPFFGLQAAQSVLAAQVLA